MKKVLCIAAAFILFAAVPSAPVEAKGHGKEGRRVGNLVKKVLHPVQTLKARRGR